MTPSAGCRCRDAGVSDNARVTTTAADAVRRIGIRLAALAQDGLTYAAGDYDLDRYQQVGRLAAELLSVLSGGRLTSSLLSSAVIPVTPHRRSTYVA